MRASQSHLWLISSLLYLVLVSSAAQEDKCGASAEQGKCGLDDGTGTYASAETGRGAGTHNVPKCGAWCADVEEPNVPCAIDTDVVPCAGEYWCTSTCELWNISVLQAATPTATSLTCEQFIRTSAYPKGGELCKQECLLAEIRPNRYPAPTGLGFFCAPGTCDPAVQNRYNNTHKSSELGLGILQCPCNWFGADCADDWVEITEVLRKERLGDFEISVFKVSNEDWHTVMKDHRPGGVVRVQAPSKSAWGDRPLEQPYALANDRETGVVGELEILTGPVEQHYFPTVTEMALRVRALPVGPISDGKGKLFINPSVAGFFNGHYSFLMDALAADASVEHVVMIATGAGLSGVRTAIASLLHDKARQLHLIYGLRDARHLPYRKLLAGWADGGGLALTLVISSKDGAARTAPEASISKAIGAGDLLREAKDRGPATGTPAEMQVMMPAAAGKLYAQHALGLSLAVGPLRKAHASLANTAIVICGRNELLLDTEAVLRSLPDALGLLPQRIFKNI